MKDDTMTERPAPCLTWRELHIVCSRMFANLAGGWRSDAKNESSELAQWADAYHPTSPEEQAFRVACQDLRRFDVPWERRVHGLLQCMPFVERRALEILEPPQSHHPSAALLRLLIAVQRVMDAVSCTYTGEARGYASELRELAQSLALDRLDDLRPLAEAIRSTADFELSWEQRCQRLSSATSALEVRLARAIDAAERFMPPEPAKPAGPAARDQRAVSNESRAVYHWAREIHPSRFHAVARVARTYALLHVGAGKSCPYPVHGLHWVLPKDGPHIAPSFLWITPQGMARVHPYIVTTREWFARQVMARAVASARRRYPDWEVHDIVPGPRIGERVLAFEHPVAQLADLHIDEAVHRFAETAKPPTCAFWRLLRPTPGAWQRHDPVHDGGRPARPPPNRVLLLVVDAPHRTREVAAEAVKAWRGGMLPRRQATARGFGYDDIRNELEWLTPAERVLLHWEGIACPMPEGADARLFEAAETLDADALQAALDAGADPNALHPREGSVMAVVARSGHLTSDGDRSVPIEAIERDSKQRIAVLEALWRHGGNVNVHTPNQPPPLTAAVLAKDAGVVRWLLEHGADDTIFDLDGDMPSASASAWGFALTDVDLGEDGANDVLEALAEARPTPRFTQAEEDALRKRVEGVRPANDPDRPDRRRQ